MNTQVFFIMLVLLSFALAYPQSAGNALYRRGGCASGGVCLTKRVDPMDVDEPMEADYPTKKHNLNPASESEYGAGLIKKQKPNPAFEPGVIARIFTEFVIPSVLPSDFYLGTISIVSECSFASNIY
jgi:hypothetical protein